MTRALLVIALLIGACAAPATAAQFLRADLPRVAADTAAAKRAAGAIAEFDAALFAQLAKKPGNLLVSPYSIATALAMARAGAAGTTRQQMDAVLRASSAGDVDAAFNSLDQLLAKRNGSYPLGDKTVPLELGTANQLFVQKDAQIVQAYLDGLAKYYGTGVAIVDYVNAREEARKTINAWVSERTKARIPELVPQGVLNELTRLVLVNAVYFKAKWRLPFEKTLTQGAPFHRLDGSTSTMQLMRSGGSPASLLYARGSAYQSVSLPYVGGLSMVLVVPDAGSFDAVQSSLADPAKLHVAFEPSARSAVQLAMPKFTFRTKTALKDVLIALGMPIAFTDQADFSAMSVKEKFLIQDVLHEAFIAVDEDGTEAAAATAVVIGATSLPVNVVQLTVDRPFLFAIRDDETGALLFMGRVVDPSAS